MIKVKRSYGWGRGGHVVVKDPLLLLDNSTLAYILGNGDHRFTNIEFEEARAIMEMKGTPDIVRVLASPELERIMFKYLDIERQGSAYTPVREMYVGQDAIALKPHITPSGTQPIVLGEDRQQAKKMKNLYIYYQHVVWLK